MPLLSRGGVSVGWSPACVASPRRGYRRVWVVPGGDTRVVSGFQPPRLFVGIDLGVFPEREVCLLKVPRVPIG